MTTDADAHVDISPSYARALAYYRACLAAEDRPKASFFAKSQYSPDYVLIPDAGSHAVGDIAGAADLIRRTNADQSKSLYVGGVPYMKHIVSRRGWEGFIVFPVFVAPLDVADGTIDVDELQAFISADALKELTGEQQPAALLEQLLALEETVGLDAPVGTAPTPGELRAALQLAEPAWPWRDDKETPIDQLDAEGLFDRWVLFAGEKTVFTIGLANDLAEMGEKQLPSGTALAHWFGEEPPSSDSQPQAKQEPPALLEPLPLNTEQRQAVELSMTEPLTVVTGPPGTGKSQVVTSILINAAYEGQTALFASKNNKAVDVVETRVNAIGARPTLLRLGAGDLQARMAAYLTRLLALTASESDRSTLRTATGVQSSLRKRQGALWRQLDEIVGARNRLDTVEQDTEQARLTLGDDAFALAADADVPKIEDTLDRLSTAVRHTQKPRHNAFIRAMWPLLRRKRTEDLEDASTAFAPLRKYLDIHEPQGPESDIEETDEYLERAREHLNAVRLAHQYYRDLNALVSGPGPDAISAELATLSGEVADNSSRLWNAWLATLSDRITPEQRKDLAKYNALTKQLADGSRDRATRTQQAKLFPAISRFLPTWAVTSLSVRNRVPFEPGFFDLVVIDEASQCDIASALPLLMRAKRAVIIGDPMQLRHVSKLHAERDRTLRHQHGLDGAPEWAYSSESLFDLAASLVPGDALVNLRDHHRSHADIIGFSNTEFYEGQLRVATHYDNLVRPDDGPAVRWLQVDGQVTTPAGGSSLNAPEAVAVVDELERLAEQRYEGSAGVVTPFRPQANRIRDLANSRPGLGSFLSSSEFIVGAAHSFQGDERDVMIFSPVVAQGMSRGSMYFLEKNPNLFNVAITRARAALVVVGDRTSAELGRLHYLSDFVAYVEALHGHRSVPKALEPRDFGPNYPDVDGPSASGWEKRLYEALHARGIVTTPQLPIEQYWLDLALLDGQRRLDIEVDGEHYHRAWDGEIARRDQLRNRRMIELGWDVMRFWVYQVRDDLDGCVNRVEEWLNSPR